MFWTCYRENIVLLISFCLIEVVRFMKGIGTELAYCSLNVSFGVNAFAFIPNSPLLTIFVFSDEIIFVLAVSDIFQGCGTYDSDTDAAALP